MNARQALGLAGSVVLFIGVFAPLMIIRNDRPFIYENINYFHEGGGTAIIVLAAVSLIMALTRRYKVLWFMGGASLALIVFQVEMLKHQATAEVKAKAAAKMAKMATMPYYNPDLYRYSLPEFQIQWGWWLLAAGAVLVIISAALKTVGGSQNRQENDAAS